MSDKQLKPAGLKGAFRVYKAFYDIDKLAILLCFPTALLRAFQPYIPLLATAYILDGLINNGEFRHLLAVALSAVVIGFIIGRLEGFLNKIQNVHNTVATRKAYVEKAEKYMHLDFQLIESPRIHEINTRIGRDNSWGSGFSNLSYSQRTLKA